MKPRVILPDDPIKAGKVERSAFTVCPPRPLVTPMVELRKLKTWSSALGRRAMRSTSVGARSSFCWRVRVLGSVLASMRFLLERGVESAVEASAARRRAGSWMCILRIGGVEE